MSTLKEWCHKLEIFGMPSAAKFSQNSHRGKASYKSSFGFLSGSDLRSLLPAACQKVLFYHNNVRWCRCLKCEAIAA